jgi:hypothetical protein
VRIEAWTVALLLAFCGYAYFGLLAQAKCATEAPFLTCLLEKVTPSNAK